MDQFTQYKKVIWAVDPFCDNCTLNQKTARAVRTLASQWDVGEVEPVYVIGDAAVARQFHPFVVRDLQTTGQDQLLDWLEDIDIPRLEPLKVLEARTSLLRDMVDEVIEYAKSSKSELLVVGTRARRGLPRLLLGSFAESLINRCDVPLFVVNPTELIPRRFGHILFPTDFSEESKHAFDRVIQFAAELKARITLYHQVRLDFIAWGEPGMAIYPTLTELIPHEVKTRQREAAEWIKRAKREGVSADAQVEHRPVGSVSDAVLRVAKKRASLIAMAAHSGPVTSALLGSTTRQVVRSARCPVWVVHTEEIRRRVRLRERKAA